MTDEIGTYLDQYPHLFVHQVLVLVEIVNRHWCISRDTVGLLDRIVLDDLSPLTIAGVWRVQEPVQRLRAHPLLPSFPPRRVFFGDFAVRNVLGVFDHNAIFTEGRRVCLVVAKLLLDGLGDDRMVTGGERVVVDHRLCEYFGGDNGV